MERYTERIVSTIMKNTLISKLSFWSNEKADTILLKLKSTP